MENKQIRRKSGAAGPRRFLPPFCM